MDLLLCLERIISDFRPLFNQQNFMLFQAFILGFIANGGGGTLTSLYQSSFSQTRYWSFPKFLSRGKWDADAVAVLMMKLLQQANEVWIYVYDETKAIKTGKSQWGLHFFRNFQVSTDVVPINPNISSVISSAHSVCYVRQQQGGYSSLSG